MPQRPRSHELEDLSIDRLMALRPAHWAPRRKGADYGVDLEFEIFEATSKEATGLLFYVQVRATDNPELGRKLVLSVEQMAYFESLPVPTLIVRYAAAGDAFHCQWHFRIAAVAKLANGQKSFTYTFDEAERWTSQTAAAIERTLRVHRRLKTFAPMAGMPVRIDTSNLGANERYAVEAGIDAALAGSGGVLFPGDTDGDPVTFDLRAVPGRLTLAINCLAAIDVELDGLDREAVASSLLYAAAAIFKRIGLSHHVLRLARVLIPLARPFRDRDVATEIAIEIIGDIARSVELALINGIHASQDLNQAIYFITLRSLSFVRPDEDAAVECFFAAALAAAEQESGVAGGTLHYSLGNYFRQRSPARAIAHYNKARRLHPAYETTGYFLREVGACCFGTRHYRCAAIAYRRAMSPDASHLDHLHLGDVLLFSGEFDAAAAEFGVARETDDFFTKAEAALKQMLCTWLEGVTGHKSFTPRVSAASALMLESPPGDPELWERVIREIDPTSELAHYNLAVAQSKQGAWSDALASFLLCAFKQSGDLEAWSNAAICCQHEGDSELLYALLASAISLAGRSAYDHLRDRLLEQGADEQLIEVLDHVVRQLTALSRSTLAGGMTIRSAGD